MKKNKNRIVEIKKSRGGVGEKKIWVKGYQPMNKRKYH